MVTKVQLSLDTQSRVRRAIFLYFFFVGLSFSSWASRIPDIKSRFMMDDAEWGLMLLMIPAGQLVGMAFSGRLISWVGSNRVLLWAIIGYAATLCGLGAASVEASLIAALVSFGFFGNFCNIAMNTQAVVAENFYGRPIMSSFHGGWSMAGLCGGLIGLAMTIANIPTNIHLGAVAVVSAIGALWHYRYLQYDAEVKSHEGEAKPSDARLKPEMFLILFGVVGFFAWVTEGAVADWSGIYMGDVVGLSSRFTPIGFTAYMIAMTIGRFLMDRATLRWGRRAILCGSSVAIFAGMLLVTTLPSVLPAVVGLMIVGFGACGVIPTLYSAAGAMSKLHTGRAITIISTISFMGFLVGPPAIGYISQVTNLRIGLSVVTVFGLMSLIIVMQIKALRRS